MKYVLYVVLTLILCFVKLPLAACFSETLYVQTSTITRSALISGYDIIDIGTLGGERIAPENINDNGDIVGMCTLPGKGDIDGNEQAFLWHNGQMVNLGSGYEGPSHANDINNRGQVACYVGGKPCLYDKGKLHILPGLDGKPASGDAVALNDKGQIVGIIDSSRVVAWTETGVRDLGVGLAHDINNRGQVVGVTYVDGKARACEFTDKGPRLLGTMYGRTNSASVISDQGDVLGLEETNEIDDGGTEGVIHNVEHSVLWQHGKIVDYSKMLAKNQIKASELPFDNNGKLFRWFPKVPDRSGRYVDFSRFVPKEWSQYFFIGIAKNRRGQIVASGKHRRSGEGHIFLLTPRFH